jgi:hypothetical protein
MKIIPAPERGNEVFTNRFVAFSGTGTRHERCLSRDQPGIESGLAAEPRADRPDRARRAAD